jgi:RNA polymerase sigma-70 factor, ECF subfamily
MDVDQAPESVSLDEQWRTLARALARAVRRQCPAWLAADADDIAQVALAKVGKSDKVGEGKPPLSSFYLHRVAHSALVDEIRRRRRRREVALEDAGGPDEPPMASEPSTPDTPESTATLRQLGASIRGCLKEMKRERRLSVMLYLQGHSVPETARLLGWLAKRTENLVYRGLADLRQCLMAKGHTP